MADWVSVWATSINLSNRVPPVAFPTRPSDMCVIAACNYVTMAPSSSAVINYSKSNSASKLFTLQPAHKDDTRSSTLACNKMASILVNVTCGFLAIPCRVNGVKHIWEDNPAPVKHLLHTLSQNIRLVQYTKQIDPILFFFMLIKALSQVVTQTTFW